jgi:phage baseplate assembly protein W
MADISDVKLNNGDLAYSSSGDLLLVSDIDDVWQAAVLRVNTVLGTYLFQSTYGTKLGQYIDEPYTSDLEGKIASEITNTLQNDSRITSINNVQVNLGTGTNVSLVIKTPYGVKAGNIPIGG